MTTTPLRIRILAAASALALACAFMPSLPDASEGQMPTCQAEDGSYGPLPCAWDGGPNGEGMHYVIDAQGNIHYRDAK